ncbi:SRPBCC domain-containing protein [Fulvivirga sp. M361]|uniref:SRPBCC family protein n=1 Tax=Fulvivirga sp. M361 TaxID=2594266 RepID=UPI00117AE8F9|nr:SRPBCC domain-containing protein [Fulvivirga sp. M361]TRX59198.1 SRPBCC domain-containing protein [Fulvivirga sp. M361]
MNNTKFTANENILTVERSFNAPLDLVWRTWTEAELLDQWWAPKPWKSETSYMDFKEGGYRTYAMVGPEGEKHMARTDYRSIHVHQQFSGEDAFCDEEGNINSELPVSKFNNQFVEINNETFVTVVSEYVSDEHLQQVIQMGMKEGLSMAFENLDGVLKKLNS